MIFDYGGLEDLFAKSPAIDYLTGETKVNKDIWLNLDLNGTLYTDLNTKQLKAFVYHIVPTELIFKPDLLVSWAY